LTGRANLTHLEAALDQETVVPQRLFAYSNQHGNCFGKQGFLIEEQEIHLQNGCIIARSLSRSASFPKWREFTPATATLSLSGTAICLLKRNTKF
jgi:hypothetical protein